MVWAERWLVGVRSSRDGGSSYYCLLRRDTSYLLLTPPSAGKQLGWRAGEADALTLGCSSGGLYPQRWEEQVWTHESEDTGKGSMACEWGLLEGESPKAPECRD